MVVSRPRPWLTLLAQQHTRALPWTLRKQPLENCRVRYVYQGLNGRGAQPLRALLPGGPLCATIQ